MSVVDDWRAGGFGLYLHWPFCESKCPYCDFNSHVAARIDGLAWRGAYLDEIARAALEVPDRTLTSVFLGGGTPSLMDPATVAAILETVHDHWPVSNDLEVTLEANPSSVEAGRFRDFRQAGINRVSIGVQALNDADLRRLGRLHSTAEARSAIDIARATFERTSFDLIYARQGQDLAAWSAELREALDLADGHLSLYQLTIEPGTAFGARHARGGLGGLPDEDLAADLYAVTQDLCGAAGLPAYEISNHATDLQASRHNLIYWRGGDYLGIGPGAHGRLTLDGTRHATETHRMPDAWLAAVRERGSGETVRTPLSRQEQAEEYLMMSLRLAEGCEVERFEAMMGRAMERRRIVELEELGLVTLQGTRLMATAAGRPVLNAVLRALLA